MDVINTSVGHCYIPIPYTGPVFNFHAMRHFMASYMADKKKRVLKTVSKLLRHENLKTTEIYLHSIDGQAEEAVQAVEGEFTMNSVAGSVADSDENSNIKRIHDDKRAVK